MKFNYIFKISCHSSFGFHGFHLASSVALFKTPGSNGICSADLEITCRYHNFSWGLLKKGSLEHVHILSTPLLPLPSFSDSRMIISDVLLTHALR